MKLLLGCASLKAAIRTAKSKSLIGKKLRKCFSISARRREAIANCNMHCAELCYSWNKNHCFLLAASAKGNTYGFALNFLFKLLYLSHKKAQVKKKLQVQFFFTMGFYKKFRNNF
jgi:hypothetical protein